MTRLYEDENFVREKEALEEQIIQASQVTADSKTFIQEMDDFLKDLEAWKKTRTVMQDSANPASEQELTNEKDEHDRLREIEEEFMKKADEREREILEKLRALNIEPKALEQQNNDQ